MPAPSAAMLREGFFEFKKNAGDGLCWVKGCRNEARPKRCLCRTHDMRRWRAKDKKTADYCTLRDHAKARGIEFNITLDYWRGVIDAFAYYEAKEDEAMSIDRVDPTRGYVEGNIRVVTTSLNSFKSTREQYLPEHVQHMIERRREKMRDENEKFLGMKPEEKSSNYQEADFFSEDYEEEDVDCPF